jgi:hypothetical protein
MVLRQTDVMGNSKHMIYKYLIFTFLTLVLGFNCIGQSKKYDKQLTDKITSFDFLTISINHYVERYERSEINIIYHQDSVMKIHSILKSSSDSEIAIDTTFILSGPQLMIIDKFGRDFQNDNINPTDVVFAGTKTYYYVTLNNKTSSLDNKSGYSLIQHLLNN